MLGTKTRPGKTGEMTSKFGKSSHKLHNEIYKISTTKLALLKPTTWIARLCLIRGTPGLSFSFSRAISYQCYPRIRLEVSVEQDILLRNKGTLTYSNIPMSSSGQLCSGNCGSSSISLNKYDHGREIKYYVLLSTAISES